MTQLSSSRSTEFDDSTRLEPVDGRPGDFSVELDAGWSSLVGVHGGYLNAIAVRGAESVVRDRTVRTVSTGFLSSGRVGPAVLSIRPVREGRSSSTVTADLVQDDRILTSSRITLFGERDGVEWQPTNTEPMPAPSDCVPVDPPSGLAHFDRAEALLDPSSLPFTNGDRALIRGWVRPREHRVVDSSWLAMICDWFPPPAFVRIDPPAGGVSVDMIVHIHRPRFVLQDNEWLTAAFHVDSSSGGLAVEHGRIARLDGAVLAESFQTRLTPRN